MGVSRGDLKNQILLILQKNAAYQGFYTDDRINIAIQDCLDYISVEMMMGGGGWMTNIIYLDTLDGVRTVPLPNYVAIVNAVRYLVGDRYVPLVYDDQARDAQISAPAGSTQFPKRYRIVQNNIYFNPPAAEAGPKTIELEYAGYPQRLIADGQEIDPQFDMSMFNYVKYRSASILAASAGKAAVEWGKFEDQWYEQMMKVVNKRIRSTIFIREFED